MDVHSASAERHFHIPHPHTELRKGFFTRHMAGPAGLNNWLSVKITNVVGSMWCAYVFAVLAIISLPAAINNGTAALVAWTAQTFLQLVLLSIIMVGQKVSAAKSDAQLEQTFKDAEALLHMNDDMHRLIKQNVKLTERIDEVLSQNMTLTSQINKLICQTKQD